MIIRYTTPAITFKLKIIDPEQITKATLDIRQGESKIVKNYDSSLVLDQPMTYGTLEDGTKYVRWMLSQADTAALATDIKADIQMNAIYNGLRYASDHFLEQVVENNHREIISTDVHGHDPGGISLGGED